MASIDMLEENKSKKPDTGKLLQSIFTKNWKDKFLFDGINDTSLSYEEFFTLISKYREKFQEIGLQKNDCVCFLLPNSIDLIAMYFVSLIMQLVAIPIDPTKNKHEIDEILSYVNYKVTICNTKTHNHIPKSIDITYFNLVLKNHTNYNDLNIFTRLNYDSLFLITFTSGTSGSPKGVMHSFNNLILSAIEIGRAHV